MRPIPNAPAAVAAIVAVALLGSSWLIAGSLTPPAGPVAPTMHSNQEIYDAVTAGGEPQPCLPAIPGLLGGFASCEFQSLPGSGGSLSFPLVHLEGNVAFPLVSPGGIGGGGPAVLEDIRITRAMDSTSHRLFQSCTEGHILPSATITLHQGGDPYLTYTMSGVLISRIKPTVTYRCDGAFVHAEELTLSPRILRITDVASGHYWEWNMLNEEGVGG